jgi:hypothetical protein
MIEVITTYFGVAFDTFCDAAAAAAAADVVVFDTDGVDDGGTVLDIAIACVRRIISSRSAVAASRSILR